MPSPLPIYRVGTNPTQEKNLGGGSPTGPAAVVFRIVIWSGVALTIAAYIAWFNREMASRGRSAGRRIVVIALLVVVTPVGAIAWLMDRERHPPAPRGRRSAPG